MAYPKLIQDTFEYFKDGSVNPDMVGASAKFAWIGPLLSALSRTCGGWLSDSYGGSLVTHYSTMGQVVFSLANGAIIMLAKKKEDRSELFWPFMLTFYIMMCFVGAGNGSVFKQIGA